MNDKLNLFRSGYRIFYWGRIFEKFSSFFRSIRLIEKQVKKAIFGHFLENFDKKKRVFLARAPPQI